ncbi:hypothetical protein [Streptomyces sp. M41(2017)]|uniref:hypothetical protein n=1 Tax=Streptomyces sp. M41(2017) TaxID=1955065 RepID=UPI0015C4392D|nr:hypothetical protein [Streptomyces sp. M41(2017)]
MENPEALTGRDGGVRPRREPWHDHARTAVTGTVEPSAALLADLIDTMAVPRRR